MLPRLSSPSWTTGECLRGIRFVTRRLGRDSWQRGRGYADGKRDDAGKSCIALVSRWRYVVKANKNYVQKQPR